MQMLISSIEYKNLRNILRTKVELAHKKYVEITKRCILTNSEEIWSFLSEKHSCLLLLAAFDFSS